MATKHSCKRLHTRPIKERINGAVYAPKLSPILTLSARRPSLYVRDGIRTERTKIFLMAVDSSHRYSNEPERAN